MTTGSIALTTLQATVPRALTCGLYDRGRVERAAVLVALGAVERIDETTFRVASQTGADVAYTVTPDGCDCEDRKRRPERRCKHDIAVRLVLSSELAEQRETEQAARAQVTADSVALVYARAIGFAA